MKLVAGIFSFFLIFITFFNCTFAEEPPGQLVKVYGYVLEVKDSEILINLGTSSSVKEKCTGQVYIIEKLDGKDKTIYLASIQILKASEAKSTAKILEAKRKIEKGQNVVIKVFKTDDISSVSSLRPLSKPLTPVPIGVHAEAEIVETIRLTKGAGCNIDPVWVPQGDRIYFVSNRNNDFWNIYTMKTDGSNVIKLTTDAKRNFSPDISADGSMVVFVSSRHQHEDIYTMKYDGSQVKRLTQKLNLQNDAPAWSPDGSKIAFVSISGSPMEPKADIYIMKADGTEQERLTMTGNNFAPDWSPDGKKLLFVSSRTGYEEIYTFDVETQKLEQLTDLKTQIGSPEWSPDGSKIAFMMNKDHKSSYICLISSDGSHLQQLSTGSVYNYVPYWSPDGQSIVFIASEKHIQDIYIIKLKWNK